MRRGAAPLALAGIVLAAFWKVLFHPEFTLLTGGDMCSQAFPWLNVAAHWLKKGTLVLWDPYVYAGKANLGELQPAVLYPGNWPFMLPWTTGGGMNLRAMEALVVAHYVAAAIFAYLLGRAFGLTRLGAVLAGIGYALSGFMTQVYGFLNIFSGFVWLPAVVLGYRRAECAPGGRERVRWLLASGVCLAISFLAGHHVPPIQAALLLVFYSAFEVASGGAEGAGGRALERLSWLGTVAVTAFLLSAVQWLPSLEWARLALRWVSGGPPIRWGEKIPYPILQETGSVSPQDLLSLVLPYASVEANIYAGAPLLVAAVAGALLARARGARFFTLGFFVYLFLSWGRLSAVHGWVNTFVPGVWFAREAFHYLVPLGLCLAMLAGWGLDALTAGGGCAGDPETGRFVRLAGRGAALLAIGAGASSAALRLHQGLPMDHPALRSMAALGVYLVALGSLLYLLRAGRLDPGRFGLLYAALVVTDVGSQLAHGIRSADRPRGVTDPAVQTFWKPTPAIEFLKAERRRAVFRVDDPTGVFPPNFGDGWLLEGTMGHGATALARYLDFRGIGWGPGSNATALLNARYFASPLPVAGMPRVLDGPEPLYRNPRAVPRVFVVSALRAVPGDAEALAWIASPLFAPRAAVVLRAADVAALPSGFRAAVRDEAEGIRVEAVVHSTAAERAANRIADDEARSRAHVLRPPWGWGAGDTLRVRFRPERAAPVRALVRYYPDAGRASRLMLRLRGPTGESERALDLPAASPGTEPDLDLPAEASVDLGVLDPAEQVLSVETTAACPARIDSITLGTSPASVSPEAGRARIVRFEPNRLEIDVELERPGFVVASEVFYPGWQASVDGRAAPLVEGDFILRAVPIEAGRHRVLLRFRPTSFLAGAAVSLATALGLGVAAVTGFGSGRERAPRGGDARADSGRSR